MSDEFNTLRQRCDQLERAVLAMVHVCEALILCADPLAMQEVVRAQVLIAQARAMVPVKH